MLKQLFLILCIAFNACMLTAKNDEIVQVQVQQAQQGKIDLLLININSENMSAREKALSQQVITTLAHDLEFSGQFNVIQKIVTAMPNKQSLHDFATQGYQLALFVQITQHEILEWRLYDTDSVTMLAGKRIPRDGSMISWWAHTAANQLWPILTGQMGCFCSLVAYCKEIKRSKNKSKTIRHIYIADYDGSNERCLVTTPTINILPRWHAGTPHLFYSEHTSNNVRLMAISLDGKRQIVANFEGLNMLPTCSQDGQQIVFCASKGKGNCQLYHYNQGHVRQLTNNHANNIAPSFAGDKVYFCSDYGAKTPHIFCYHFATGIIEPIIEQGYCVSPAYCAVHDQLAYAKIINGTMQLFMVDLKTKHHRQLTFDAGDKEECSWSPCGNYVIYCLNHGLKSRIAMLNVQTGKQHFITKEHENTSYPSWSPIYHALPTLRI